MLFWFGINKFEKEKNVKQKPLGIKLRGFFVYRLKIKFDHFDHIDWNRANFDY